MISMRCKKSDVTIQIECEQRNLKSRILKSKKGRNETMIQTLLGTNEKTKITTLIAGIILLIAVAVTLGLFIGLLDPATNDDSQQTTKTLFKACQGNTEHYFPYTLASFDYTKFMSFIIAFKLPLI